ncbi:septum formation initiator family protein [Gordonia sp. ABSL1-1]|uniref:FtsB family cell division protein n=1 Tax=Gordonia sp. ABSL1-1 TaxID=3053923 RepID=UPI002573FA8D|nr:septum formation initiator family protein [Gordonia sp. ABSL1-1]MDL9938474.1 septum formation initiator family protein [Gordonia sp. ABSL1-1]
MASDGRRRARDTRLDSRTRERARATRRRSQPGARRGSPVSTTETGEHELRDGSGVDDRFDTAARLVDAEPGPDATADGAAEAAVERTARPIRSASTRARRDLGGPSLGERLLARAQRVDAKRAVVLALVISVVSLTLAMPVRTYFEQRAELNDLTASNAEKRRQVVDYQQKVNEQNDPAYIEAKARSELLFVKPGETPLVMMFPGDEARKAAAEEAEKRARAPWYGNLFESIATPPGVK